MMQFIFFNCVNQAMKLLAIETATESCSVAVLLDDEIFSRNEVAPRKHNELVLGMCEQLLDEAEVALSQLDAVAFGRGPGAFTGVRLAASVTQGIAMGQDIPVVPVSSLAALAQGAYEEKEKKDVFACIDARMQEVYYGYYQLNAEKIMQLISDEQVLAPNAINLNVSDQCYGVGSGWAAYAEILQDNLGSQISYDANQFPRAEYVAKLAKYNFQQGEIVSALEALPVYLRDNVAEKPKNKVVF